VTSAPFDGQQHQHLARAGAHGAQHGQFAPAFVQPGQHHGHQRSQADQGHQPADGQQRLFAHPYGGPQLVQRHAGQHGQQRFVGVVVDETLHVEHRDPVLQAHQRGRHLLWLQIELARHLGRDLHPRRCRQGRTADPVQVDGFYGLQADVHRAVHGRAGGRQHTDHGEGLVGVFGCQRRTGALPHAVRQRDALAQGVAQRLRHFAAQHGFVKTVQRAAEGTALRQHQGLPIAIGKVREVLGCGAQHRVAAVAVAQGNGHDPGHGAVRRNGAHAVHPDVVGGAADAEHGVQHQLHRPGACAHHQVGAADRLAETGADVGAQSFQAQQQGRGQGDGQHHQRQRAAPVERAAPGNVQQAFTRG
jgi:hypothetical protein